MDSQTQRKTDEKPEDEITLFGILYLAFFLASLGVLTVWVNDSIRDSINYSIKSTTKCDLRVIFLSIFLYVSIIVFFCRLISLKQIESKKAKGQRP